jgi:putative nucleotidyltransferase with HDIG domain
MTEDSNLDQRQTIAEQRQTIAEQRQTIAEHRFAIAERDEKIICINDALRRVVDLMGTAIELRDPYTKGHSDHVAEITLNIAESGFPDQFTDLEAVRMAAIIHDVGKIAVNEIILNKPTLLTEAEFEMIKSHTFLGSKLITHFDFDPILNDAILRHHENFDGSGYPDGLKGNEIPLIARIIRVADYFDALTSCRPYRPALQVDEAINIMRKKRHFFDPDIFNIFLDNKDQLTRRCI